MQKRAYRCVTRRWKQSLIFLLTFTVLLTSLFVGSAISSAIEGALADARHGAAGIIQLQIDAKNDRNWSRTQAPGGVLTEYIGPKLTDAEVEQIARLDGISSWNGIGDGDVCASDFSFIEGLNFGPGSSDSRLPSVSASEKFAYFRRGVFRLVEGRHIRPDDNGAVLISSALARHNGLRLGDTITVKSAYTDQEYPEVSLDIVGIYECRADEAPFATTSTDKRNRLITDHQAMKRIMLRDQVSYDNGVDFFVDDPARLQELEQKIRALDIDWSAFELTVDNSAYEALAAPLQALQSLTVGWVAGIPAASAGIALALQWLQIRQRSHEIGLQLALGIRKRMIVGQIITETLIISTIATVLALFCTSGLGTPLGNQLLLLAPESPPIQAAALPDDGSEYLDITGAYLEPGSPPELAPLDIKVDQQIALFLSVAAAIVCAGGASAAGLIILRRRPRVLLSSDTETKTR